MPRISGDADCTGLVPSRTRPDGLHRSPIAAEDLCRDRRQARLGGNDRIGERPGGPRALLADRDYLRLWLVGGFANAVRWLELLAAGVFAYDQTGSGLVVAAMTAARMLPMLLIGALAGAVADTLNRRTLLLAGQGRPAWRHRWSPCSPWPIS